MKYFPITICPAPAGLVAVFCEPGSNKECEHREPIVAFGIIDETIAVAKGTEKAYRHFVPLVLDYECGSLEPVDASSDFLRVERQPHPPCSCIKG
ncbi:MAG: hypothetical protein C0622_07655 [Desulfuromonas sp.]|mgnify:CR=1 FL=1|nr:MAG: hypothetical protein C0622_07655 [Desulfuromonas sp.]